MVTGIDVLQELPELNAVPAAYGCCGFASLLTCPGVTFD